MKKIAIAQTNKNDKKVLKLFTDKVAAFEYGKSLNVSRAQGVVYMYESDFDESGNQTTRAEKFYGVCN